ncbi:hypothetical protein ACFWE3_19420 [Mycobacteriaceae bacterium NPDC060252]
MSHIDSHGRSAGISWLDRVRLWVNSHRRHAATPARPTALRSAETGPALSPLDLTLAPFAGISADYVWSQFVQLFADDQASRIELDEHQQRQPLNWRDLTSAVTRMVIADDSDIDEEGDGRYSDIAEWLHANQEPLLRPTPKAAALCVWLWRNGLHAEAVDVYGKIWNTVRTRHREEHRIGWPPDTALEGFRHAASPYWDNANHEQFCTLFRQRHVDPQIDRSLNHLFG